MDDGEIILQRRITAEGKTTGRVNGVPVTASQLRELGALLLDIHGQNDGRQLLDERRHLDYLDAFGECGACARPRDRTSLHGRSGKTALGREPALPDR